VASGLRSSFAHRVWRWAGLPDPDGRVYDGVASWRAPAVLFVVLLPVMTASMWLVTRGFSAIGLPALAGNDLVFAPGLAGVFVVVTWPWAVHSPAASRRWLYCPLGFLVVTVGSIGAQVLVGPLHRHDLAHYAAASVGTLAACLVFAALTRLRTRRHPELPRDPGS